MKEPQEYRGPRLTPLGMKADFLGGGEMGQGFLGWQVIWGTHLALRECFDPWKWSLPGRTEKSEQHTPLPSEVSVTLSLPTSSPLCAGFLFWGVDGHPVRQVETL